MHALNTRINTAILIFIALTGVAIVTMLATRAYGGPLDPPGAPSPTQPNLIYQPASCAGFPIVLSAPGSYKLASNITGCAAKDGIQFTSGNITFDLAGFSIIGVPGSLDGIKNMGGNSQLSVANGSMATWGGTGLNLDGSSASRVDNIIAAGNGIYGMVLGSSSALSGSTVSGSGSNGVVVVSGASNTTISDCNVDYNGNYGISAADATGVIIRGCSVGGNAGAGIDVGAFARISDNHVHHNSATGITAGHSCMIENNSSEWNSDGSGIYVLAPGNCTVARNKVTTNSYYGIDIADNGANSLIDGNHAADNGLGGFRIGEANRGYPNIVTRNVASFNFGGNYDIGSYNAAAPISAAFAATDPMNISE